MIKVALLGDSIRQIGYGPKVPSLLGDEYSVWQPNDNCRFALYTLRGMFDWRAQLEGCDVVHWNNGLWDICELFGDGPFTEPTYYVETMLRIAGILQKYARRVIFATTTPVLPANAHNKNAVIADYNRIIVPRLEALGIAVDDLYSIVYPKLDEYIRSDDNIHLTEAGIDACSAAVADSIRRAAAEL